MATKVKAKMPVAYRLAAIVCCNRKKEKKAQNKITSACVQIQNGNIESHCSRHLIRISSQA
jgi:hypothetical protein